MTTDGLAPAWSAPPPGARWAGYQRPFDSPALRVRYRAGVRFDPSGHPCWDPLARAVVTLPPPRANLTLDEQRVLDVLTANAVLADDTAAGPEEGAEAPTTPPGWVWAHQPEGSEIALLPAEAHGAFRHRGGVVGRAAATGPDRAAATATTGGGGLRDASPARIASRPFERVSSQLLDVVEQRLGHSLPAAYRRFLAATNGAAPAEPAVHPRHGFVFDQPLFGLARTDRHQDLIYANGFFDDRLTNDFLAIGYVQGGSLALRVRGDDAGSVWFHDADDPRDDDRLTAADVCARLLYPVASNLRDFWAALARPPAALWTLALDDAAARRARRSFPAELGTALPRSRAA